MQSLWADPSEEPWSESHLFKSVSHRTTAAIQRLVISLLIYYTEQNNHNSLPNEQKYFINFLDVEGEVAKSMDECNCVISSKYHRAS